MLVCFGQIFLALPLVSAVPADLAELKELALDGVNGKRKSSLHEYVLASCAVSHVLNAQRIGNYFASSSAIFGTQNSRAFRE